MTPPLEALPTAERPRAGTGSAAAKRPRGLRFPGTRTGGRGRAGDGLPAPAGRRSARDVGVVLPQRANPGYLTRRAAGLSTTLIHDVSAPARPPGACRAVACRPCPAAGSPTVWRCAPAAAQPRIRCPQGHAVLRLHGGGQVHAPVTCGENRRKPRSAASSPSGRAAPPSEPGDGSQPRGGSGATLHLPPRCCPPRSASCEESRPEPPPRLPLRRGANAAAGRGPGRGARKPDAARSFARRAHKVPALPALPTAGRPRRAAPALRPREEGGRGGGGGEAATELGREGGREGAPARGEPGEEKEGGREGGREEGGRGPPAPPPSPHRQESAIRPPRGRSHRRRRRSPGPARLLSPARTGQRRARRRAPAPQSNRYRSRAPPGRAGRGGAQRSARLPPPPARRGHSLARARRPLFSRRRGRRSSPPAECGPRDGAPLSAEEGGGGVSTCGVFNGGGGGGAPVGTAPAEAEPRAAARPPPPPPLAGGRLTRLFP
ncbi:translation initiation factor IF-2-like [Vidua macroura]|uniref:translation initiation factor IF-2-like n=1 Tax=Vidua macroura TaxID=187451 RepID=UPI0023A7E234|nr:translation initiation factor IF-2-like [Vidua macroura]